MNIYHENIKASYSIRCLQRLRRSVPHWHQRMEILLVERGSFRVTVRGEEYIGTPGDAFVIRSGQIHHIQPLDEDSAIYVSTFPTTLISLLQPSLCQISCYITRAQLEQAGILQQLKRLLDEMLEEESRKEKYAEMAVQARIQIVYGLLARHFEVAQTDSKTMDNFLDFQAVLSYINENYKEQITLADIAKQLNYSSGYVSTMFLTYTGQNFKAYLDSIRIHEASRLLLGSNDSVSHICSCCGFDNIRTFNNVFRRVTGMTPSQFRKGG